MKRKLFKFSLWMFIVSMLVFLVNYFVFHFVTDSGRLLTWNPEPGKPFICELIGTLGVLFFFGGAVSLMLALIVFNDEK